MSPGHPIASSQALCILDDDPQAGIIDPCFASGPRCFTPMTRSLQSELAFMMSTDEDCICFFCSDPICCLQTFPAMDLDADSFASFDFLATYAPGGQQGAKTAREADETDRSTLILGQCHSVAPPT